MKKFLSGMGYVLLLLLLIFSMPLVLALLTKWDNFIQLILGV